MMTGNDLIKSGADTPYDPDAPDPTGVKAKLEDKRIAAENNPPEQSSEASEPSSETDKPKGKVFFKKVNLGPSHKEWVYWANLVVLRPTKQIGVDRMRLVLILLAMHANEKSNSWPSKKTLEGRSGLSEWVVGNAIRAMKDQGVIVDTGRRHGRGSVEWHLKFTELDINYEDEGQC